MSETALFSGPYTHTQTTVQQTMLWVMAALLPATLFGLYQFGWPAVFLFLTTLAACLLAEALCLRLAGKPLRPALTDGSALLTGWLLALTLPPWAPWWIAVVGALLAIVVSKQIFGGLGQNLFNPAMVARVALLISFPLEMTQFHSPAPLFSDGAPALLDGLAVTLGWSPGIDALSSATTLGHIKTELSRGLTVDQAAAGVGSLWQLAWGETAGSLGETSSLLLLLGGLFLIYKRIITWHIPLAVIAGLMVPATLHYLADPAHAVTPLTHLTSGAALLCAFFIATDPVTSPVTARGQLLFGIGIGLLIFVIRTWAGYPEGVAFAVMLMNGCTPLIDHYLKPRIYGRDSKGEPLQYIDGERGAG